MPLNHNKLSWLKLYAINFWIEVNYLDVSTKCKETEHIEEIEKNAKKSNQQNILTFEPIEWKCPIKVLQLLRYLQSTIRLLAVIHLQMAKKTKFSII